MPPHLLPARTCHLAEAVVEKAAMPDFGVGRTRRVGRVPRLKASLPRTSTEDPAQAEWGMWYGGTGQEKTERTLLPSSQQQRRDVWSRLREEPYWPRLSSSSSRRRGVPCHVAGTGAVETRLHRLASWRPFLWATMRATALSPVVFPMFAILTPCVARPLDMSAVLTRMTTPSSETIIMLDRRRHNEVVSSSRSSR